MKQAVAAFLDIGKGVVAWIALGGLVAMMWLSYKRDSQLDKLVEFATQTRLASEAFARATENDNAK